MTTSPRPTSALIVHAHPEPTSFSSAQAQIARDRLTAQGYTVDMIDLYTHHWNPVLTRAEFTPFDGPFKPQREQRSAVANGTLPAEVATDLDRLLAADLLVLSFPLWWFSMPAILKGWLDRVLVMGAVFGGDFGLYDQAALAGRRAVLLTTTGAPAESYTATGALGDIDDFLFHIHRGVLEFVGYDALEPVVTYGPAHLDQVQRADALARVQDAFDGIGQRGLASTSRAGGVPASAQ